MKKTLLFLGMFLSMLSVMAEDNVLQTIEIVPVKDTYNIVLVSDKAVDVKKTVQASNKITLDLKNIRASKTLNTVYNNVSNVDTVMVEPIGNGISIFFQAENAQDTSVSFDALAPVIPATKTHSKTQRITLNNPVESYAPIYKEEIAQEKTSDLFNKLKQSSAVENLRDSIDESTISDSVNKVISFGLVGLLIFAVTRLFRRREPEMKIGLSQSLNEREIEMYRGQQPIGSSYVNVEKRKETCLKKYGKENYFETEEFKKKARKTKEIKYGDSNFTNNEKRKETCKQRYGGNSCMSSEIVKQKHNETMLERYNVKFYSMTEDWYTKTKITSLKKYGKVHYTKTDEYKNKFKDQNFVKKMIKKQKLTKINNGTLASSEKVLQKVYDTKRKNGTLTTSKPEILIYNKLKSKFQDIIHIYRDKNRYPYNCDFYIPSKDLFIELNFHWTHGKEPFNANNQKHLEKLNLWKKRAEKSKFYQTAIDVWTKRDPQKMHTACINRLLYYTFYTEEQFNMWYNNI